MTVGNAMASLQRAQRAQIAALAGNGWGRSAQPLNQVAVSPQPTGTVLPHTQDRVSLGGPSRFDSGLIPDPRKLAQSMMVDLGSAPLSNDPNYWEKQNAYYDRVLHNLAILKALEAANEAKSADNDKDSSKAKKGDLNVVAGNRKDGVKAKKVTIHEHRKWGTRQWDENRGDYRSHESKFENAKVGSTYQVNVEWEDGTTTTRDVRMDSPGQTVHIDTAY